METGISLPSLTLAPSPPGPSHTTFLQRPPTVWFPAPNITTTSRRSLGGGSMLGGLFLTLVLWEMLCTTHPAPGPTGVLSPGSCGKGGSGRAAPAPGSSNGAQSPVGPEQEKTPGRRLETLRVPLPAPDGWHHALLEPLPQQPGEQRRPQMDGQREAGLWEEAARKPRTSLNPSRTGVLDLRFKLSSHESRCPIALLSRDRRSTVQTCPWPQEPVGAKLSLRRWHMWPAERGRHVSSLQHWFFLWRNTSSGRAGLLHQGCGEQRQVALKIN